MKNIENIWRDYFITSQNNIEIMGSNIISKNIVKRSGHLEFFPELFKINQLLYLRPETTQSIYQTYKYYRYLYPLKKIIGIAQIGYAFRHEKSTEVSPMRAYEFKQMELELFFNSEPDQNYKNIKLILDNQQVTLKSIVLKYNSPLLGYYLYILDIFFKTLDLEYILKSISPNQLPHYSVFTIDVFIKLDKFWQVASISNRGTHDLKTYEKNPPRVLEFSFGLYRIFMAYILNKTHNKLITPSIFLNFSNSEIKLYQKLKKAFYKSKQYMIFDIGIQKLYLRRKYNENRGLKITYNFFDNKIIKYKNNKKNTINLDKIYEDISKQLKQIDDKYKQYLSLIFYETSKIDKKIL